MLVRACFQNGIVLTSNLLNAVLPSFAVIVPKCLKNECVGCKSHLKWCMESRPQVAQSKVQNGLREGRLNNHGATCWGFQQLSPRYGVLTLDAPPPISLEWSQLARRNPLPDKGLRRLQGVVFPAINQPPLANAPGCGSEGRASAEGPDPRSTRAQRAVFGSPGHDITEMTSNCNPQHVCDLQGIAACAVSASTSLDGAEPSSSQGVTSC